MFGRGQKNFYGILDIADGMIASEQSLLGVGDQRKVKVGIVYDFFLRCGFLNGFFLFFLVEIRDQNRILDIY